jgi:2Fe-2S ferredoxin
MHGNKEFVLETYPYEYRSLMHLIFDKIYLEDFGDCKGMGRCGTCLVEIINDRLVSDGFERNEQSTLNKSGYTQSNQRLSCQILVDKRINDLHCRILLPDAI